MKRALFITIPAYTLLSILTSMNGKYQYKIPCWRFFFQSRVLGVKIHRNKNGRVTTFSADKL